MTPRPALLNAALLLLLLFAPAQRVAQAQEAEAKALLEQLQKTYQEAGALRAEITQTTTSEFSDGTSTLSGTLLLQDECYRVETDQQTVVTDGETVWIYTPAKQQVLVNDYVKDETAFSPSEFFTGYAETYMVRSTRTAEREGQPHYMLQLAPRAKDEFFREVTLWLRKSDGLVTRVDVRDANETKMIFTLDAITFDPPVSQDAFIFRPPSSAEVIDLREG